MGYLNRKVINTTILKFFKQFSIEIQKLNYNWNMMKNHGIYITLDRINSIILFTFIEIWSELVFRLI